MEQELTTLEQIRNVWLRWNMSDTRDSDSENSMINVGIILGNSMRAHELKDIGILSCDTMSNELREVLV